MSKIKTYFQSLQTEDPFFNITFWLIALMLLLLPHTTFFMWPFSVILSLVWLIQWNFREKWQNFKTNDGIPYGFFLFGICLIPVLGFINSENLPIAWRTLECHLWFFFAPLFLLTTSPKLWKRGHFNLLLGLFSISVIANLLFKFFHGVFFTLKTGDSSYMYNNFFSYNQHHAYVALYANFAYILIFQQLLNGHQTLSRKAKVWFYILELLLAVGIFCLYSRAGILIFLFLHLVWCAYAIHLKHSRWKVMTGLAMAIFALFTVLIATSPSNRFTEDSIFFHPKGGDKRKVDARRIIWQAAWDGAVENLPWGVGTGDGNDVVVEMYHKNGHWLKSNHPYNAHNQFLFALLTNGIPGIIILLLYFWVPLGTAIKHKDMILLSLFLLMTLNCLVECMFDRRAGVDFFAIMIPLFIVKANSITHQTELP